MQPEGWKKKLLSEIAEVRTGVAKNERITGDLVELPYLRVANVQDGHIDLKEVKTIKIEKSKIERYLLQPGDILMTEGGDFDKLGRGDVWQGQISPCLHQNHIFVVRPNPDKLNSYFLAALSSSYYGRQYFLSCAKRSTNLASINSTQLKNFPIYLPPLFEQQAIMQILSTWDKAISTADALLENSRQQKKALMQQLLTGKRRLPGFKGEWNQVKLKKIGTTYAGLTGKSKEDFGQGNLFIPYLNVFKNSFVDNTNFEKVTIYDNEKQNSVKYGDILFTISSETPHEVGMSSVFLDHIENVYLNSFCFGFRMKNFSTLLPQYARFLFRGNNFRGNIGSLAQGATRYNLSKTQFLEIAVLLPPLDEQRAIAAVLDAADREITLLEQKAARLREEKKALMQQLLTGKRRVRV